MNKKKLLGSFDKDSENYVIYFRRAMTDRNTQVLKTIDDCKFGAQVLVGYIIKDVDGHDQSIILCERDPKFNPFTGESITLDTDPID
jgi:hypothetical protein